MRNVESFTTGLCTPLFIDMDKVVYIELLPDRDKLILHLDNCTFVTVEPSYREGETKADGVQRVIDLWVCGKGRPEFVEGWFDAEGPNKGWGDKCLVDLSGAASFSYAFGFLGRAITVDYADHGGSVRHTFWLKADPDKTPEEQGAELEARWRRARGERA